MKIYKYFIFLFIGVYISSCSIENFELENPEQDTLCFEQNVETLSSKGCDNIHYERFNIGEFYVLNNTDELSKYTSDCSYTDFSSIIIGKDEFSSKVERFDPYLLTCEGQPNLIINIKLSQENQGIDIKEYAYILPITVDPNNFSIIYAISE